IILLPILHSPTVANSLPLKNLYCFPTSPGPRSAPSRLTRGPSPLAPTSPRARSASRSAPFLAGRPLAPIRRRALARPAPLPHPAHARPSHPRSGTCPLPSTLSQRSPPRPAAAAPATAPAFQSTCPLDPGTGDDEHVPHPPDLEFGAHWRRHRWRPGSAAARSSEAPPTSPSPAVASRRDGHPNRPPRRDLTHPRLLGVPRRGLCGAAFLLQFHCGPLPLRRLLAPRSKLQPTVHCTILRIS
ncbi:hypothetical protein U9M48_029762, partial [Paspalum notatum var. saurae]